MSQERSLLKMLAAQVQHGEFRLASGRTSEYYLDARRVTLTSLGAAEAAAAILRMLDAESVGRKIHAIGGPATACLPLVGACLGVTWRTEMVGFYTLASPKDHGTGGRVHGPVGVGMTVVLIDDVATSGNSLLESARAVRELGCKVDVALCLVDRVEGAAEALAAEGIRLRNFCTVHQLGVKPREPAGEEAS